MKPHKQIVVSRLLVILGCLFLSCGESAHHDHLTIAAAANTQYVLRELQKEFTDRTGIECSVVIGSSGKLTAQIKEGAPYHLFLSANMKYPQEISEHGLSITPPKTYAYGGIALWTMDSTLVPDLKTLHSRKIEHIAIANPKSAPYGKAAVQLLKEHGVYNLLIEKLVYGESIAQTNQFITSGAADIGFTALSVVRAPEMNRVGYWMPMDKKSYKPIPQGIVLIKGHKERQEEAKAFYDFIFSPEAQKILAKFGYWKDE